ncbi:MAG: zf-HC2 domain-containing protein [Elusimicrobia bacterium]|nr:zf-HC2 domain-containing protein [Candidatus Obscuribacterium magneticum]
MEHEDIKEKLILFFDGELPMNEQQIVRQHVESCTKCREELAIWNEIDKRLVASASAAIRNEDTEEFVRRVMDKLPRPRTMQSILHWNYSNWWKLAAIGAVSTIILLFVGLPRKTTVSVGAMLLADQYSQDKSQLFLRTEEPKTEELAALVWEGV